MAGVVRAVHSTSAEMERIGVSFTIHGPIVDRVLSQENRQAVPSAARRQTFAARCRAPEHARGLDAANP